MALDPVPITLKLTLATVWELVSVVGLPLSSKPVARFITTDPAEIVFGAGVPKSEWEVSILTYWSMLGEYSRSADTALIDWLLLFSVIVTVSVEPTVYCPELGDRLKTPSGLGAVPA